MSDEINFYSDSGGSGGFEDAFNYEPGAEDIQLPYIRLAQGLTPEVQSGTVKPGQWILPDGSVVDTFQVLVKGMRRVRRYRAGDEVSCRSDDGVVGIGDPGGPCNACPLSMWSGDDKKRVPPACTLSYQYLVEYSTSEAIGMGVVSMSTRSASKVASQIAMYLKMYGTGNTAMMLGASLVAKGVRKYHVPTVLKAGPAQAQLQAPSTPPVNPLQPPLIDLESLPTPNRE